MLIHAGITLKDVAIKIWSKEFRDLDFAHFQLILMHFDVASLLDKFPKRASGTFNHGNCYICIAWMPTYNIHLNFTWSICAWLNTHFFLF